VMTAWRTVVSSLAVFAIGLACSAWPPAGPRCCAARHRPAVTLGTPCRGAAGATS
jgi:hypothetical protein